MLARNFRTTMLAIACGTLATACATTNRTESVSTGEVATSMGARSTATLSPENRTTVVGDVVVEPTNDPRRMQVRITVHGAPPNLNLPWSIHRGTCETDLGVYGSASAYPMIGTSSDGRAQLQTVLSSPPPSGGSHVVKVFAGPGSDVVVACGDLRS